jgi:hypothetical protein
MGRTDSYKPGWIGDVAIHPETKLLVTAGEHMGEVGKFVTESAEGHAWLLRFEDGEEAWVSRRSCTPTD